ncbi:MULTISPECIES: hypothetical protein [Actinosynnema]|uniref:hypothetical protein n=1 Tax=Actinosynnema TaxID=40566 RepID=UPI0020A43592|nr:hypothetical protein [Actinosynnema pretiosum]MCP2094628.1 hypothetical protein [Actinosynnema pretiosum]
MKRGKQLKSARREKRAAREVAPKLPKRPKRWTEAERSANLLAHAKSGTLTLHEAAEVADALVADPFGEHSYERIYTLGRSFSTQYEGLIAGYLTHQCDDELARIALQTLCGFWGMCERYLVDLRRFLDGADNDPMGFVRVVAVSAAGEHLRDNVHSGLLAHLLDLAALRHDEDQDGIKHVVDALSRALGDPHHAAPVKAARAAWEEEVLRRARERLAVEPG